MLVHHLMVMLVASVWQRVARSLKPTTRTLLCQEPRGCLKAATHREKKVSAMIRMSATKRGGTEHPAVAVVVEQGLRTRLRLVGKHRRTRVFLEDADDEKALRRAIETTVPPLREVSFGVEVVETNDEKRPTKIRVVGQVEEEEEEGVQQHQKKKERVGRSSLKRRLSKKTAYDMVSWYAFFDGPILKPEDMAGELRAQWANLGVMGRAYVAKEGVNAQLAVPAESRGEFEARHRDYFGRLLKERQLKVTQPENSDPSPMLNFDARITRDEWARQPPFRNLHVRARDWLVADDGFADELDLADPGREVGPDEWHDALENTKHPLVLDVRNHYETAVGTFKGAIPLGTETFKDAYSALNSALKDHPKTEPVYMCCTGGIRCVKAGAHVKQTLGFQDVRRLEGGIVNYANHLRNKGHDLNAVSAFRGLNYVFNDRMAEVITSDLPPGFLSSTSAKPNDDRLFLNDDDDDDFTATTIDARSAEAVSLARARDQPSGLTTNEDKVYAYAEKMSGEEPELLWRVRLDAEARFPAAAHMLAGPTQGRFLSVLCALAKAKRGLELGTFCGYGTLWLAKGLGADGSLVTVDRDPRTCDLARKHFARAAQLYPDWASIELVESDTDAFLRTLGQFQPFDLVYLDADKKGYAAAVDALFDAGVLAPGALVVADNTLWKGTLAVGADAFAAEPDEVWEDRLERAVADARRDALVQNLDPDKAQAQAKAHVKALRRDQQLQQAMHEFNVKIRRHPRLEQVILPLRDGITIARVLED